MDLTFKFEGLNRLQEAFKLLPKRIAIRASSNSVKKGAKIILKAAKSNVPVDTGNLKKSLAIKILNKKRDAMQVVALIGPRVKYRSIKKISRKKYNERVNDGFYGRFVEYGTKNMHPQPFLRPAFDNNKVAVQQAILDTVFEAIDSEAKKFYGIK